MMWGKAEELKKQESTKFFATERQAYWFALEKQMEKENKGYELVASL
jgi:hypothetical protein